MAQKAAKTLATRNAARLNYTLYITLGVHLVYVLLRLLIFRSSFQRSSLIMYILFSLPSVVIEFWFESIARPTYTTSPSGAPELKRSGEDLEAKGLTEYMWDVLYWTWINIILVAVVGDYAWWLYAVVPAYSAWLAWTTLMGYKQGMSGMVGAGSEGAVGTQSKRQQKMEKRGGHKMVYR
ncbi:DUF788 domain protein [Pseudovirgaria hyperparasitica]|uniref:DUF788 domain protein n=1 Tax=Pseudovirgaria hyperparasitica TaxID=470096 RepID=A0A6A6W8G3_9PEZI|nr:DUF788 domain protein [Pseudovirgaria hyperparasitica]KAF2758943.1 DUF788 domain protein [Pseudovirgaria hyperparasitica]